MTFESYFGPVRERLRRDLGAFLIAKRGDVARLRPWGRDVLARLVCEEEGDGKYMIC